MKKCNKTDKPKVDVHLAVPSSFLCSLRFSVFLEKNVLKKFYSDISPIFSIFLQYEPCDHKIIIVAAVHNLLQDIKKVYNDTFVFKRNVPHPHIELKLQRVASFLPVIYYSHLLH